MPPPPLFDEEPPALEEELIGSEVYGVTQFFQYTTGGDRSKFRIRLVVPGAAGGWIYYKASSLRRWGWGWFSLQDTDCTNLDEQHDTDGDGQGQPGGTSEAHCIPNAESYELLMEQITWSSNGSAVISTDASFTRTIAMLDREGGIRNDGPGAGPANYHDVYASFDLASATPTLTGEIRAGTRFVEMSHADSLYGTGTSFTIGAGDTLWFIATYNSQETTGRPWYGSVSSFLTGFNRNYSETQEVFTGAVNSVPRSPTPSKPFLSVFTAPVSRAYTVVGRVHTPSMRALDGGDVRTGQAITVNVVAPVSCFTYSPGAPAPNQAIIFNASCSSAFGTVQRRWKFGSDAWKGWTTSASASHAFNGTDVYEVQLEVKDAGLPPVSSSSQYLTVGILPDIGGPELITESGSYTWPASATGGQSPFSYGWYYWKPSPAEYLDGLGATYSRYVSVTSTPYTFRLRLVMTDANGTVGGTYEWIEVVDVGGGGAAAPEGERPRRRIGTLDALGQCRPRPDGRRERKRFFDAIVASGRWPVPCVYQE